MGAFEYTALDTAGRSRKGVIEGDTARHVRSAAARAAAAAGHDRGSRGAGVAPPSAAAVQLRAAASRPRDLSLMTRQLSTLVRAGLPLEEALLAVSQQTEKPRVQSIVLGVRAKVVEGHTLAAGLATSRACFPRSIAPPFRPASNRAISMRCSSGWPIHRDRASRCARR